jgi:hypothetical protein
MAKQSHPAEILGPALVKVIEEAIGAKTSLELQITVSAHRSSERTEICFFLFQHEICVSIPVA